MWTSKVAFERKFVACFADAYVTIVFDAGEFILHDPWDLTGVQEA